MDSALTFNYPGRGATGGRAIREGGTSYHMCKTATLNSKVLVLDPGVRNELHAHADEDAHYFVLDGRVTFYGQGDKVLADLVRHDGLFVPHRHPYWFASSGDVPLELLRVSTPAAPGASS
jgi:mannose-6-phosphate isomerase-like protein (cupin superfamily)